MAKCEQLKVVPICLKETRKVDIISYRKSFIKDDDNLYGGCKPVLDALVNNELIFDDRREYCLLHVHQIKVKKDERTVIIIRKFPKIF